MAKVYGNRWETVDNLGKGGQGDVFRVTDRSGKLDGFYALKRLINRKRRWRFENEVKAVTRLDHPNIIRLVDNSALVAGLGDPTEVSDVEKSYLVMPIAQYGDLSRRPKLTEHDPKATLDVALPLAQALAYAHRNNVIHRDVKPQNILFSEQDHNPWLADFGLCLIRDEPERKTQDGEEVGPAKFMAPELEGGLKIEEVGYDVDVYSLGKVIYYMLSGGVILPRELWNKRPYSDLFDRGEQFVLIGTLLSRMICGHESRIQTMDEVVDRIFAIQKWPTKAKALPTPAIDAFASLQKKVATKKATDVSNAEIASKRATEEQRLINGILKLIEPELQAVADAFAINDEMSSQSRRLNYFADGPALPGYRPIASTELLFTNDNENLSREHVLRFTIFSSITYGPIRAATALSHAPKEREHTEFAMLASYRVDIPLSPHKSPTWYNVAETGRNGRIAENLQQLETFSTSNWTDDPISIKRTVEDAIVGFAKIIAEE